MNKWDDGYDEKSDSAIRIIKDYDLVELSLVDSPANQFANILSVEKVDGVDTITGEGTETVLENVFWDKESGLVTISEEDSATSPVTGVSMQNIGFVEKSDADKLDMIKFLVDSAKGINTSKTIKKENDNMTDENVNVESVDVAPEAEVVVDAPATEEVVEDAPVAEPTHVEEVVEEVVPGSEEEIAKAVSELGSTVTTAFSDITAIIKSLADANASLVNEVAELKKSLGFVTSKVTDAESGFNNLGKRIDAVEADTAFRKSGDLGEVIQEPVLVEKSVWGGSFLTTSDLLK
jgi:hypothetical protein